MEPTIPSLRTLATRAAVQFLRELQKQKEAERNDNERKYKIEAREILKPLRNKYRAENEAMEECYKNVIVFYKERIMELYHDEVVMCEDTECFDLIPEEEAKQPYIGRWSINPWSARDCYTRQETARAFKCRKCSRMLCAKHSHDRIVGGASIGDLGSCHDCYQIRKCGFVAFKDTNPEKAYDL